MTTPMIAWDKTQQIGRALAEMDRANTVAELNAKLARMLRYESSAYRIDEVKYAISEWSTKPINGPFFYEGIESDFADFVEDTEGESFVDIAWRMMNTDEDTLSQYFR